MESEKLLSLNRPGGLCAPADAEGRLRCLVCAHACLVSPGQSGRCLMRVNRDGQLLVPGGYVSALNLDPVEKKPFYHFLPGAAALSFGMLGCNFHCPFCQNWRMSQCLRDPQAVTRLESCSAEALVQAAEQQGAEIVASTYNEPLITLEWSVEIFTLARRRGLRTAYVSNGFASREAIACLAPWLDAINVDLKCFTDENYRRLGGRLQPVIETIRRLKQAGVWVEVTTLVVPDFNDSDDELSAIANFLAATDPDLPWHVSAYHANYTYRSGAPFTPRERIDYAREVGKRAGLNYIYAGNVQGSAGSGDTVCHKCAATVVKRNGFAVESVDLNHGVCPHCRTPIPGVWS